jgi:putative membrane protein
MRVKELLDPAAFAAIEAAVRDAERCTSGEIVPLLAERSDDYAEVRFVAAFLLAVGAGALWLALVPDHLRWLLPTQFGVFALAAWLAGRRALLRWLAPHAWLAERVHRAAELAFHQLGMVETRDRTGILIYVSLLERRVVVLADRGIHARVADGTWDGVVARVVEGIRRGEADEGLVAGIRMCGEILSRHVPPGPNDPNELADRPRGR